MYICVYMYRYGHPAPPAVGPPSRRALAQRSTAPHPKKPYTPSPNSQLLNPGTRISIPEAQIPTPVPQTLFPGPLTLDPNPQTLTETLSSKPGTRNLKPLIRANEHDGALLLFFFTLRS